MIANANNIKDVDKYFCGTYIVVPEVSETHVMYLQEAKSIGLICKDSRNNKQGLISFDGGFEYKIQSPLATRKAWFMFNEDAYLITRIPARMWRKGICSENTALFRLTAEGELSKTGISVELLNAFLQDQATPWDPQNLRPQVLSPEWVFHGKLKSLYLWDKLVAKWTSRTNELFVPRELQDLKLPAITNNMKVQYV